MIKKKQRDNLRAYLFLLPAFVIYISVIIFPVFYSTYISFFKWNGIGPKLFVFLKNYTDLLKDEVFFIALKNNLIWTLLTILFTVSISLGFALILDKNFPGRTFFRGFFYFPCVIAPIAVAIIWRWIYNPNVGFINELFEYLGSDFSQSWISNPKTSLYAIYAASLWQTVGLPMILFLAGLKTIPIETLEAADIDGANSILKFFNVTIPLLKETFIIVFATQIIAALKVFDIIQGLTAGGPNNSTEMLSTYMYSQTFRYNNVGKGATIAVVMVLIMLSVIIPYISHTSKET